MSKTALDLYDEIVGEMTGGVWEAANNGVVAMKNDTPRQVTKCDDPDARAIAFLRTIAPEIAAVLRRVSPTKCFGITQCGCCSRTSYVGDQHAPPCPWPTLEAAILKAGGRRVDER